MNIKEQEDFISLITAHRGIIHKVINLYIDDPESKKDLFQEILLQAWRSFPSFRGEARFSTWLYKVSLNTLLTNRTRDERYKATIEQYEPPEGEQPHEHADLLYGLVKQLPPADRIMISLHLEGYKNVEIADILGISPNALGVKIYRLKEIIANQLKKDVYGSL